MTRVNSHIGVVYWDANCSHSILPIQWPEYAFACICYDSYDMLQISAVSLSETLLLPAKFSLIIVLVSAWPRAMQSRLLHGSKAQPANFEWRQGEDFLPSSDLPFQCLVFAFANSLQFRCTCCSTLVVDLHVAIQGQFDTPTAHPLKYLETTLQRCEAWPSFKIRDLVFQWALSDMLLRHSLGSS